MGQDLKFSEFSQIEHDKIQEVLLRDEALRTQENNRMSTIQSEVTLLDHKVGLLAKDNRFRDNHCLQCFSQFIILFNPKVACSKCQLGYCKKCLRFVEKEDISLCLFCRKKMTAESQKNSWFYENVQSRFKIFGSEKVKRLLSRGRSEEFEDDLFDKPITKRPSLGDVFFNFRTSTDNVSDSGFSTASSRRNLTLFPNLKSTDTTDSNERDVDLEVMLKEDASRSSWNLTPIKNKIPSSNRSNYLKTSAFKDEEINQNHINDYDRRSSLSSEISDDIIDDIVSSNQDEHGNIKTTTRTGVTPRKATPLEDESSPTPPSADVKLGGGDAPVFLQLPTDVQVAEGAPAEFVCLVEGTLPIEVYWYREGNDLIRIDENETEKYVVSKAGRAHGFVVMETSPSDRGYYLCIAANDFGRKEHMVKLTVLEDETKPKKPIENRNQLNIPASTASARPPSASPTARPRLSRPISTEVIRCGDFSLSSNPSPRPKEVFPDEHFVSLSKDDRLDQSLIEETNLTKDTYLSIPDESDTRASSPYGSSSAEDTYHISKNQFRELATSSKNMPAPSSPLDKNTTNNTIEESNNQSVDIKDLIRGRVLKTKLAFDNNAKDTQRSNTGILDYIAKDTQRSNTWSLDNNGQDSQRSNTESLDNNARDTQRNNMPSLISTAKDTQRSNTWSLDNNVKDTQRSNTASLEEYSSSCSRSNSNRSCFDNNDTFSSKDEDLDEILLRNSSDQMFFFEHEEIENQTKRPSVRELSRKYAEKDLSNRQINQNRKWNK